MIDTCHLCHFIYERVVVRGDQPSSDVYPESLSADEVGFCAACMELLAEDLLRFQCHLESCAVWKLVVD